jgi:hypothetical protein
LATAIAIATATALNQLLISYKHALLQELLAHLLASIIKVIKKAISLLLKALSRPYAIN